MNPGFLRCVEVRNIDGTRWVLTENLTFQANDGRVFEVPRGFQTDFASSRILRWDLLPRRAAFSEAAVLHDFLYATGKVSRLEADQLFREALLLQGNSRWVAAKAYYGVRMFGGKAWAAHRRADSET